MAAQWLDKYGVTTNYDEMVADYEKLPKQSFDYEVLEHWKNIVAVQYDGIWKDLGTWNTLTDRCFARWNISSGQTPEFLYQRLP